MNSIAWAFTFVVVFVQASSSRAIAQTAKTSAGDEHVANMKAGLELFQSGVRAILVERCLACHGGDTVEGGYSLATREALLKGGDSGLAVTLKAPDQSRLLGLIKHIETPAMPYEEDPLSKAEIALIEKWISLGAPYTAPLTDRVIEPEDWTKRRVAETDRNYWAYRPLRVAVPAKVATDDWSRNDLDTFVAARHVALGIRPNPAADRQTLIRRAFLDVTGLPPTPAEVRRWQSDTATDWFDRLVDELLDSPHYGERWARHWLDVARFAESHGFEQDYNRDHAYHYRDFVIQALNADMPYDQFVQWQIAGDELAPDDPLALMATGFLGAGVFPTQLTEKEFESARYDELDDMIATLGTAMLATTIGCARCHDHKFDPIPASDYYRLLSAFGKTIRSHVEVDLDPHKTMDALAQWNAEHAPLVHALHVYERTQLPEKFDQWLSSWKPSDEMGWMTMDPVESQTKSGAKLVLQADGSLLATGKNANSDQYTLSAEVRLPVIRSIRVEALPHPSMTKSGPGRATNGNFGLSRIRVFAAPLNAPDERVAFELKNPRATFEQNQNNLSIAASLDDDKKTGWAIDPQFGKAHMAAFELAKPIVFPDGARIEVQLDFEVNRQHSIGRPRLSVSQSSTPTLDGPTTTQSIAEIASRVRASRQTGEDVVLSQPDRDCLMAWYRTLDDEWQVLNQRVFEHDQRKPSPKLTTLMVSTEGQPPLKHHADGRGYPHFYDETFFLKRGDVNQKARSADAGVLQILRQSEDIRWFSGQRDSTASTPNSATRRGPSKSSGQRSAVARWITDERQGAGHLLARVIVNRLWQHHFGQGIVATSNDFGKQGSPPTHPELLDWLAAELIKANWRLKPIHRLIMCSATYRMNSTLSPSNHAVDPDNKYLSRYVPRRLEAEVIRDATLAVSQQLDRTPFGPGSLDPNHRRRSIYFMIKRSQLIPQLQIFDAPEPLTSAGNRPSTTIASQALHFLNSAQVRSCAESLAQQVLQADEAEHGSATQIHALFMRALSRPPTKPETDAAQAFLAQQSERYQTDGVSAETASMNALTDLSHTILSLNEFIYID